MTFKNLGEIVLENYELKMGDDVLCMYIHAQYEVECEISRHSHNCPVGEDYPDGEECRCIYLELVDCYPCDEDGNEITNIDIPTQYRDQVINEMKEIAENDYCEHGSWGRY